MTVASYILQKWSNSIVNFHRVERNDGSVIHLTGIKGALRWWYEVLVRGLDYYACDPTDDSQEPKRCELLRITGNEKKKTEGNPKIFNDIVKQKICPVCYLFGCTGAGIVMTDEMVAITAFREINTSTVMATPQSGILRGLLKRRKR